MRRTTSFVAIVAAAFILAACTAPPATGGSGGSDGGSGQSEQVPGAGAGAPNTEGMNPTVPPTWPAEVPLPDGRVINGLDLGTGWSVAIAVDDPDAAYAHTTTGLVANGFTQLSSQTAAEGSFGVYENALYQVQVSTLLNDPEFGTVFHTIIVMKG
jgi:hypothetical protein